MSKINVSNYMITHFAKFEQNGVSLSVMEYTTAFSFNTIYNSGASFARNGLIDFVLNTPKKFDSIYNREYCDRLLEHDRYSFAERIVFFELMRISLPTYSIILDDDRELEIEAFFSIYDNGYVAISHIYKEINCADLKKFDQQLEYWDNVKGIKLDLLMIDLLDIDPQMPIEEYKAIGISKQDFFKFFNDIFDVYKELIIKVLSSSNQHDSDTVIETKSSIFHLRTFEMFCEAGLTDRELEEMSKILSGKDDGSTFNKNIHSPTIDLSLDKNETILLNHDLLIFIKNNSYNLKNRRFAQLYSLVEYFYNERCKLYEALRIIKGIDDYDSLSINQINDYKNRYIDIMKIDINFELLDPSDAKLAHLIREKLGIDILNRELKIFYEKQFNIAQINTSIKEKNKERNEKKKDSFEKQQRDNKEHAEKEAAKKLNNFLAFVTILFSIPTVNEVVDMLYNLDGIKLFYFPIGYAKPISCVLVGVIIIYYFNKLNKPR